MIHKRYLWRVIAFDGSMNFIAADQQTYCGDVASASQTNREKRCDNAIGFGPWGALGASMKNVLGALVLSAFVATPVMAADLPARMPVKAPPVVAPVFTWTGCYIGAHGGYGWGHKKWSNEFDVEFTSHDVDGWLVGGQVGCQIQQDRWVFGIEGQASWADIDGDSIVGEPASTHFKYSSKTDVLGTIALRLGYAVDRTLFYAKGGLAFAHDKHSIELLVGPQLIDSAPSEKYMRWGWMVGGGIEYAFTGNWSAKIEYNYMHLGREDVQFCSVQVPGDCDTASIKQHIHVVKAGINYRFGAGGPVVARY
jgi:outer membrane immunogenic protein